MIPRRLSLRNFMSYGDDAVEVDFTGLHVVCLSGDNGNGKSALLDAMTYALWGKTRISGSRAATDTDLIRLGAEDMEVRFEFSLDNVEYRSVRTRHRASRGGDWSLHARVDGGDWIPVGGSTQRETERVLERLLRIPYDTFINSAYLAQGRADEFVRRPPTERKKILADILNLGLYDDLRAAAMAKMREFEGLISETQGELRALDAQIAGEEKAEAERSAALASLAEQQRAMEELQRRVEECRCRVSDLEAIEMVREGLHLRREEIAREKTADAERIERLRTAMENSAGLIAELPSLHRAVEQLQYLRELKAAMAPAREEQLALLKHRAELERAIEAQRLALESRRSDLERDAAQAQKAATDAAALENDAKELARRAAEAGARASTREMLVAEHLKLQERFSKLKAGRDVLVDRERELEEILQGLVSEESSVCPVCGSDLSPARRADLLEHHRAKLDEVRSRKRAVLQEGQEVKARMESAQSSIREAEAAARALDSLTNERALCLSRCEALRAIAAALPQTEKELRALEQRIALMAYAKEEREQLTGVLGRLAALETSLAELQRVEAEIAHLEQARVEARRAAAMKEEEQQDNRFKDLEAAETRLRALADRSAKVEQELQQLNERLAGLSAARMDLSQAEAKLAELRQTVSRISNRLAVIQAALDAIQSARSQRAERQRKLQADTLERELHQDLARIFGKSEIQARIIENAIPDIENEANLLLSRMTDNALQLRLRSQREARSGGSDIETLDIEIADQAGTRPLELFSGGEAFRVNFALRIALSRLLTRRAGTTLRTLILDEGFGTQDAAGRERLVEAIEAVRDDFALILVITHIDSLKDAFPNRLEVTKDSSGSQVTLLT